MAMDLASPEPEDGPRRGGRVRKTVERYNPPARAAEQEGEDEQDESDLSDEEPTRQPGKKRMSNGRPKKLAKPKKKDVGEEIPVEPVDGFKNDSALFNALLSPDIALQQVVDDWVETYQQTENDEVSEKASMQEMVLFFVRCCGLSANVDEDEAMDEDDIIGTIERIQDESVHRTAAVYPLVSKTKNLRPFRNNLNNLVHRLIKTLALTPCLYETSTAKGARSAAILPLLLSWLHSMSSSPLRPIRHTSTYITLKMISALAEVASEISQDLSVKQRQRDVEVQKGGKGPAALKRVKTLEEKVNEAGTKKAALDAALNDSFDTLFVHRVRDADPAIRKDCLRELGVWIKKYEEFYVTRTHLQYLSKSLNDPDAHARVEAVKAASNLFSGDQQSPGARDFLSRLAPRLVEIALRDVDLSVRVNAISLITQIDQTGMLADPQEHTQRTAEDPRQRVARLMFNHEPRIRKAIGGFVRGLYEEDVQKLQTQWAGAKQGKKKRSAAEDDIMERLRYKALAALLVGVSRSLEESDVGSSRQGAESNTMASWAKAAVESLRNDFEELQEWHKLAEYLLLDHSQNEESWLMEDDEETMMLHVLVESVKQDDSDGDDLTKTLIDVVPRLFTKHQADSDRISGILTLVKHMKLSVYAEMRKMTAYESLWDDVIKQFLQHTDEDVLKNAAAAIDHLASEDSTANTNSTKLVELEDNLFASLRETINGEEVFSMTLEDDQLITLQAILLRIKLLQKTVDISDAFESEEGGQSSVWEIVLAFAERGEVGYKAESMLVEQAIRVILFHIARLLKNLTKSEDASKLESVNVKINRAVKMYDRLALMPGNASDSVRQKAFRSFLELHTMCRTPAAAACTLTMNSEVQNRVGQSFGQIAEAFISDQGETDDSRALNENLFLKVAASFVGAVQCGVLDIDHAKDPLALFGRCGPTYDAVTKKLAEVLRDEGIYNKQADLVQHVADSALKASFTTFLEGDDEEPTATVALAKTIASSFIVHGTHFTVLRQIHPNDVCDMHRSCLDFISRRLANYHRQLKSGNRKSGLNQDHAQRKFNQCLAFFKVLVHLLGPITGTGAVSIRKEMEEIWKTTGMRPGNAKAWDSWRAYDKRLVNIASKDPNVKMMVTQKAVEDEDSAESSEHEEEATEAAEEDEVALESEASGPKSSTPLKRSRQNLSRDPVEAEEEEVEEPEEPIERSPEPFADVEMNLNVEEVEPDEGRSGKAQNGSEPKKRKVRR
ncbi:STAG domain-domain-containing protein [Kockovaella imperatae]|uniref:STAG domain-domain-containing protein n=1 Tax=Kockovaella imperatae TaxID=4999 RepID=A0A1Y1UUE5_9TREE|nr:STAG domain-domain-containing protein [Kockovaella imperatae]ORX41194.1 STAG domain-domain-containing protein [Kockovaella imperatae]